MAGLPGKRRRGLIIVAIVSILILAGCSGGDEGYIENNEAMSPNNYKREAIMRYGLSWCRNCDNAPVNRIDDAVPNYVPAMDYANMLGMEAEWLRNEYCQISGRTLVYMNFTFGGGRTEEIGGWLDSDDVEVIDPRTFRNGFPELEQTIPIGGSYAFGERRAEYWQTIFRDIMIADLARGGYLMLGTNYGHAWIEYIPHYSTGLAPFSIGFLGEIMFNTSRIWHITGGAVSSYTTAIVGEQIYNIVRWVDCVLGYCHGINDIGEPITGSPTRFHTHTTNSVWFAATAWTHATGVYIPYFNFTNPIDPFTISPIVYHHNFLDMYGGRPWFYRRK